ncbi:alkylglycerol monooxygenase-like [Clytia hemisphaerica]|uniref:Alkylglycerol monooxygenase n=1 Tax=Clytia hemisphaerica TaxID=252671 RepID=A0A7M5TSU1_9CNID
MNRTDYKGTGKGTNASALVKLGRMFYAIHPDSHTHQHVHQVPDYVVDAFPFFTALIVLEFVIMLLKGKNHHRIFYIFTNVSGGMIEQIFNKMFMKPFFFLLYCYLFQHYRVCDLPWDSVWTWYFVFLTVDFFYYWFHRASHEVNIIWCAHQMHHSSEDYNMTTALRQSFIQSQFSSIIYLPMSLFIPPSLFLIHGQFNLLYQFWIHTEAVEKLGPLEYILNTASHHRVHHGRNPYCIDKNYGGTLIIWDRLFGTFGEEKEEVAYGLVHEQLTANPFKLQVHHFYELMKRFMRLQKWSDKLSCLFRGPGWMAECEKEGLTPEQMELPEVEHPIVPRDVKHFEMENRLESLYVLFNFGVADIMVQEFFARRMDLSVSALYTCLAYLFGTFTSLGVVLENRWYWPLLEVVRCSAMIAGDAYLTLNSLSNPVIPDIMTMGVRAINVMSLLASLYVLLTGKAGRHVQQQKKVD